MFCRLVAMQFAVVMVAGLSPTTAAEVRVTIQNLAPATGTFLTPLWVGFHDGTFDTYDLGSPASPAIERIAEDGDSQQLFASFKANAVGGIDSEIFGAGAPPVFDPGESASITFILDQNSPLTRYFSYASMIIPSNDAFIANGDPMAHPIFDPGGKFLGADFIVLGSAVRDAGTEVNDELPQNTAFFGQAIDNTGVVENGVITIHPGFNSPGSGGILDAAKFAGADFKLDGYQIARITVSLVPEPSTVVLAATGALAAAVRLRRRRH